MDNDNTSASIAEKINCRKLTPIKPKIILWKKKGIRNLERKIFIWVFLPKIFFLYLIILKFNFKFFFNQTANLKINIEAKNKLIIEITNP